MKKVLFVITALCFALSAASYASASSAGGGFGNFIYSDDYSAGFYSDVDELSWYARFVEDAYNYGFIRGIGAGPLDPEGFLTLGEAVKLAACINSIYRTGVADFVEEAPFYAVYADYALEQGLLDSHGDYAALVTRSQFAMLMSRALPPEALPAINSIPDCGIPDVVPGSAFHDAVYTLYRAGIMTGSDRYATFFPNKGITRAEACAAIVRLADPASRIKSAPPAQIPAEAIYERSRSAVFLLETFDSEGDSIRTGTGFFISDTGLAVTNLHVIENAASANATLSNGDVVPVRGIHAASEEFNLLIFSIDSKGGDLDYLNIADSDLSPAGSSIYALGNPLALVNTITEGIVSNAYREVDGNIFFQFTAPISFGSGGSPVLNSLGQVVGVASSSFSYGQNLNLAVPSNLIKELEIGECVPLSEVR